MKRKHPETKLCAHLMKWKRNHMRIYPCLKRLYHVDNEGVRAVGLATKLGIIPGVSDYHFAARTKEYIGLYLEIKAGTNKPTPNQKKWLEESREYGFKAEWTNNLQEAIDILDAYAKEVESYRKKRM